MTTFPRPLALTIEKDHFMLLDDFVVDLGDEVITVPQGTRTDLASMPKTAYWLGFPRIWGPRDRAAVVHDRLYATKTTTRKKADRVMLRIMLADRQKMIRAFLIYVALRLFGWWAWRRK
ncbi:MAG: DUF1353 domain-containing protein [bacterium]|nr:DUF1353 domain-containing protein [bacterium]